MLYYLTLYIIPPSVKLYISEMFNSNSSTVYYKVLVIKEDKHSKFII